MAALWGSGGGAVRGAAWGAQGLKYQLTSEISGDKTERQNYRG